MPLLTKPVTVKGFLRGIEAGGVCNFQYNPEEVEDRESSRWANISIAGMHNPRLQYGTGEGRTISFTLKMYHSDGGMTPMQRIRLLRSFLYPDTGAGLPGRPPTRVIFALGKAYKGVTCIVTGVTAKSSMFDQAGDVTYAEVEITLVEISAKAISYSEVR